MKRSPGLVTVNGCDPVEQRHVDVEPLLARRGHLGAALALKPSGRPCASNEAVIARHRDERQRNGGS